MSWDPEINRQDAIEALWAEAAAATQERRVMNSRLGLAGALEAIERERTAGRPNPTQSTQYPSMFLNARDNPPLAPGLYPALVARNEGPRRDDGLTLPDGAPSRRLLFPCGAMFAGGRWRSFFIGEQLNIAWYIPTWRPSIFTSQMPAYEEACAAWRALGTLRTTTVVADADGLLWRHCVGDQCVTARSGLELARLVEEIEQQETP